MRADRPATKALSLAPDHAFAHLVLGSYYSAVNRNDEAIAEFEHALILDRNLVYAHALIGSAKTALGRAEEAENHYREALRLSPRDVSAHHWMSSAATSKLHLAKDAEAVLWFRRAIEANRNFAFTHLSLAAALAHLGRIDEARAAAKAGLELEPSFTIARFRAGARSENPVYLGGRDRIYEGMRAPAFLTKPFGLPQRLNPGKTQFLRRYPLLGAGNLLAEDALGTRCFPAPPAPAAWSAVGVRAYPT